MPEAASRSARIGVVTISDRASAGLYADESGPAILAYLGEVLTSPWTPLARVIPDGIDSVSGTLVDLADREGCDLILTTGGTGPAPRDLTPEAIGGPVDLIVADLSFISLGTVLPALTSCAAPDADIVPMVKPQFEVGRGQVGAGGVVHEPALRASAVLAVAVRAAELGWGTVGVTASPLPGPSGNVEYFLWLRRAGASSLRDLELAAAIEHAVAEGPQ